MLNIHVNIQTMTLDNNIMIALKRFMDAKIM